MMVIDAGTSAQQLMHVRAAWDDPRRATTRSRAAERAKHSTTQHSTNDWLFLAGCIMTVKESHEAMEEHYAGRNDAGRPWTLEKEVTRLA